MNFDHIKEQILSALNIQDVVSDFISLKKKGVNYIGLCPFHNEKTPSFTVSPAKNMCKCFGCGKGGNVISFVMEHEKLSYEETLRYLAKKASIDIPEQELSPEEKAKLSERENLLTANRYALGFFQDELKNSTEASKYLTKDRGFSQEIIKRFQVGYSPNEWKAFLETATGKGYKQELLLKAGLIGKKEETNYVYDRFKGRVIFPFFSASGQPLGFTGRITKEDKKNPAKYLNTPDTPLFHKREVLFGLYQSKVAIIKTGRAYLVEGNTDVMSFHQNGLENTVCSSGTALTKEQLRQLHRLTSNLTIIMDGDSAGLKAAIKGIDLALEEGFDVRLVILPQKEDPDSMARKLGPQLSEWLNEQEKDFIVFKSELLRKEKTPQSEGEVIESIAKSIACINNPAQRESRIKSASEILDVDREMLRQTIGKDAAKIHEIVKGFSFLNHATEAIRMADNAILFTDKEEAIEALAEGQKNVIAINHLGHSDIQNLKKLTSNIEFKIFNYESDAYKNKESEEVILCKKLIEYGFNIQVSTDALDEGDFKSLDLENQTVCNFIDFYALSVVRHANTSDVKSVAVAAEKVAETFALCNNTIQTLRKKDYAKLFNLYESKFWDIVKPFVQNIKNKEKQAQSDIVIDDEKQEFDASALPSYVDEKFFHKHGYFAAQNKKKQKIFYVFKSMEGNSLLPVANFYLTPLFQVYHDEAKLNKRVVKITSADTYKEEFLEFVSDELVEFGAFKKVIFRRGGYVFENGKPFHHEKILSSTANSFPLTYPLIELGTQKEGFFSFADAIFYDNTITRMDDLGLVTVNGTTFYSPSCSKVNDIKRDQDEYEQQRNFNFTPGTATFEEWAKLVDEVYKINNNGKWAILMAILAANRSIIYPIRRLFTSVFLVGPTSSGKTQVAVSIRSVFFKEDAPLFNLNQGTDAAFFTLLEKFVDCPVVLEEYNDMQISDNKFQGIKSAVYDGEGRQKMKGDAASKQMDISKINSIPIPLGQEAPERDDGALYNRTVILNVPKVTTWSDEAAEVFADLKKIEKEGLHDVLIEILKLRPIIKEKFKKEWEETEKKLKKDLKSRCDGYENRILITVSIFTTMCKLWEEHATNAKLPFTYEEFYEIALEQIINQSAAIAETNRLATFFQALEILLGNNKITSGKELHIELVQEVQIRNGKDKATGKEKFKEIRWDNAFRKIVFLRIGEVHTEYTRMHPKENLSIKNLNTYIKDHPAYIGSTKSHVYRWEETKKVGNESGNVTEKMKIMTKNTSGIVLDYEILKKEGYVFEEEEYDKHGKQLTIEEATQEICSN
jgi:DNA primase catalytic core